MNLQYLAHAGVEHTTPAEASAHETTNNWPVVAAVTAVIVIATVVIVKILSALGDEKEEEK